MSFLRCCLLFAVVIFALQQFVASQFLTDEVLLRGVPKDNGKLKIFATSLYQFAILLYEELLKSDAEANVFFSPLSIYIGLAMIYEGAAGETKKVLEKAIQKDKFYGDDDLQKTIQSIVETLVRADKTFTLKMANRLYHQIGLEVNDEYKTLLSETFDAGLESVDFKKNPTKARTAINKWIEKETSGKIRNLFPENAITNETDLALANAVYFNGSWLTKFHSDSTDTGKFTKSDGAEVDVPIMHRDQKEEFFYASDGKTFELIELPYSDKNFAMVIVLEKKKGGFKEFLKNKLQGELTKDKQLKLSLPKFSVSHSTNMKRTLTVLGMKNLFESAELSGIGESKPLKFTDAYHKAFINVDESGTEAARATGFEAAKSKSKSHKDDDDDIDFNVDHPFLFVVYEKSTGGMVFFGHIQNPKSTN